MAFSDLQGVADLYFSLGGGQTLSKDSPVVPGAAGAALPPWKIDHSD
ncbi:unnamed protein product, partial [Amoebophrya sp. A120]|eukprot:GSA120T00024924001.1